MTDADDDDDVEVDDDDDLVDVPPPAPKPTAPAAPPPGSAADMWRIEAAIAAAPPGSDTSALRAELEGYDRLVNPSKYAAAPTKPATKPATRRAGDFRPEPGPNALETIKATWPAGRPAGQIGGIGGMSKGPSPPGQKNPGRIA
jgi:hypothetical protein